MIATWMMYATLIGLFASLAAHALDRAASAHRLPTRFIWLVAMTATLIAPLVAFSSRQIRRPPAGLTEVTVGAARSLAIAAAQKQATLSSRVFRAVTTAAASADRPVAYVWAVLTLILLGRLVAATIMLWQRRFQWTSRQIDGIPIFLTPDLGPAVVALPRSRILLPEWLLSLDSGQVSTVLRHEREHHLAGDAGLLVFATVMTALVPWNLAMWWQSRRLRLAVEMDCDARVLRADPRVDRYGTLLLAIAQHPRAALHGAATLTESTSDLERRIDAMTSPRPSAPRIVAGALSVVAAAAVFAACMTPAPDVVAGPQARPHEVAVPNDGSGRQQPMPSGTPLAEYQVEQIARPFASNPSPMYPTQLRTAGIGGVVVAKFVVDTAGRAVMGTFFVVKSDHDLFTQSVRNALPQMRWTPAEVGGRKVKQLIQMPFIFSLGNGTPQVLEEVPARPAVTRRDSVVPLMRDTMAIRLREVVTSPTLDHADGQTNEPPKYPAQLRAAQIEGQVIAKFVLRPDGTVDMRSFEIVKSDHDLFSKAVKDAISSYRFTPAKVDGVAVSKLMTMPFVFSLSK